MYCKKKKKKIWSLSPRGGKEKKEETGITSQHSSNPLPNSSLKEKAFRFPTTMEPAWKELGLWAVPGLQVRAVMLCWELRKKREERRGEEEDSHGRRGKMNRKRTGALKQAFGRLRGWAKCPTGNLWWPTPVSWAWHGPSRWPSKLQKLFWWPQRNHPCLQPPRCPRLCGLQNEQEFVWQDSDSGEVCRTGAGKGPELPTISGIFLDWFFKTPGGARLLLGKCKHDKPKCSKAWLSRWASVWTPLVPGSSGPGHIGWSVQAQGTVGKSQFPSCSHSDPSTLSTGNGLSEPSWPKEKRTAESLLLGKENRGLQGRNRLVYCFCSGLSGAWPRGESPALPQLHRAKLGGDPFQEHL